MRNLKKILALVLALVMSLSLVTVANAAYVDGKLDTDEDVNENYDEAVTVLKDMGIFQGYNGGESFEPQKNITRAEVATLLYRIVTADVDGEQANLYVDGAKFTDLTGYGWAQGYIGYCANGGIAKGRNATTFAPGDDITGYEVLAMILRAIGYDKNGEFTGANWSNNVAKIAQELGILANVDAASAQLSKPATRELVAELLFSTMTKADMVEYTTAFGYQSINNDVEKYLGTLGWKNFYLWSYDDADMDYFGRPGWYWIWGDAYYRETNTWVNPHYSNFLYVPAAEYTTAVTECDVAHDMGWNSNKDMTLTVNGQDLKNYKVEVLDTVGKVGAQGRLTEVYEYYDFDGNLCREIVMVDTYLAYVSNVTAAVKDLNGHTVSGATVTLNVYDKDNASTTVTVKATGYEVGDYVLVQAAKTIGNAAINHGTVTDQTEKYNHYYIDILGEAEAAEGVQSVISYYADAHIVDGTTYPDNVTYSLDEAGSSYGNFIWFFDQFGNIIGSKKIVEAPNYGVINNIQWINQTGDYGYAWATLTLIDGSTMTTAIYGLQNKDDIAMQALTKTTETLGTLASHKVSTDMADNMDYVGQHLYVIENSVYPNMVNLTEVTGDHSIVAMYAGNSKAISGKVVDSNTLYLYGGQYAGTGYYSTTTYTGFNNIPNFENVTVDYVDVNNDGRIEYVYVKGATEADYVSKLFYMTNKNYSNILVNDEGTRVNAYALTGILDGVADSTVYIKNTNTSAITWIKSLVNAITSNGHVMAALRVEDGFVVGCDVLNDNDTLAAHSTLTKFNAGTWASKWKNATVNHYDNAKTLYKTGDVITVTKSDDTKVTYDVTNSTQFVFVTYSGVVNNELANGTYYGSDYAFDVVHNDISNDGDDDAVIVFVYQKLDNGVFAPVSTKSYNGSFNKTIGSEKLTITYTENGIVKDVATDTIIDVTIVMNNGTYKYTTSVKITGGNSSVDVMLTDDNTPNANQTVTASWTAYQNVNGVKTQVGSGSEYEMFW